MHKIFVIDDEEDNLRVFSILFKTLKLEYGFECDLYLIKPEDTEDLENKIMEINPDIIFLDIKLPSKSGIEIFDSLRMLGYNNPIIAQTASVTRNEVEVYSEIFSDGLLEKPISHEKIINALENHGLWIEKTIK